MFFALKHVYYDSYHLGNTFKSPFYPVNPEVSGKPRVFLTFLPNGQRCGICDT